MNGSVVEGVSIREQVAAEWLKADLWWVMHALHHVCLFSHMSKNASCCLVLVDERQFRSCLVEQDLLDHAVGATGVHHRAIQSCNPGRNHDRKHDRVSTVEGILLDQDSKGDQGDNEPREQ